MQTTLAGKRETEEGSCGGAGEKRGEDAGESTGAGRRSVTAAGLALATALVLVTVLAAWEPWGPARIRSEIRPAEKVTLFYRQGLAYYGLAEPAPVPDVPRPAARSPRPIATPALRQMLATVLVFASCAMVIEIAGAALGSAWWGAALVAIFLWLEWTSYTLWMHSVSDGLLALFATVELRLWVMREAKAEPVTWRFVAWAALAAAGAAAAAPGGIAIAAATVAYLYVAMRGRGGARARGGCGGGGGRAVSGARSDLLAARRAGEYRPCAGDVGGRDTALVGEVGGDD